ncbi:5-methylcytosine-specific restriction protein A [Pseudomonas lini]|uniref:HNH endonuclease n=1 Tax=Pseudomonas lini TaxID=163011 RepID=UPI00277E35DD|nr:HNH endonuclease signature motif containing protein [Pseudomonas lini]MDQ0124652.1 5-methylcytosine-specific restriction protein A [Pseudomonas lini]
MKLPAVKKEKLERALRQFDEKFRHRPEWKGWMDNQAHRYAISANDQLYPAKKIVSLATGTPVGDFSGGHPTNGFLKRHGFTIVNLPRSSEPELRFEVGQVYDRQTEIHDLFGGNSRSGISPSAQSPAIFIFTGDSGGQYGYEDTHGNDGVFSYTGEGQSNDMTLTKGNLSILQHAAKGRSLHVFEALGKSHGQRYVGEYACASHEWRSGLDKYGNDRQVVVFNLVPVGLELGLKGFDDEDETSPKISLEESRRLALSAAEAAATGGKGTALRAVYRRSKCIANYVLRRADGKCESCEKPAPFVKKNGLPYLEPHHVNRVSDGGLDHPRYIGAICPDCHREIHHGLNGEVKNEHLKIYVASIERLK